MLKRFSILGLVLLLAGGASLFWTLAEMRKQQQKTALCKMKCRNGTNTYLKNYKEWVNLPTENQISLSLVPQKHAKGKTNEQFLKEQQERLTADMENLAVAELVSDTLTNLLYGSDWQKQVNKYNKWTEIKELILTGSIVCACLGGIILLWCLLLWTARLIIKAASYLSRFITRICKKARGIEQTGKTDASQKTSEEESDNNQSQLRPLGEQSRLSRILAGSGWHNFNEELVTTQKEPAQQAHIASVNHQIGTADAINESQNISVLLSDKESVESELPDPSAKESTQKNTQNLSKQVNTPKDKFYDTNKNHTRTEDLIRAQTKDLEKQIAEFKQTAQDVQQWTQEQSQPINTALQELSQQITAIREYASQQQDKVEKLQDGYDWNIIRTFCLKIIRCIDNLDARIGHLKEQDISTEQLEEVRDELIFALESSGVEQYQLQINSDYRGQEKFAEAIRDKQVTDDPNKAGKIANIIRAGYKYFVNEETIKVVRTAQVKLFDEKLQKNDSVSHQVQKTV